MSFLEGGEGVTFCWNADGCRQEGGRGQKSQKFADVLNGWSHMIIVYIIYKDQDGQRRGS